MSASVLSACGQQVAPPGEQTAPPAAGTPATGQAPAAASGGKANITRARAMAQALAIRVGLVQRMTSSKQAKIGTVYGRSGEQMQLATGSSGSFDVVQLRYNLIYQSAALH